MNQETILDLLKQAAKSTSAHEFSKFQIYLTREVHEDFPAEILNKLLVDTYIHNKAYMPLLFPLFALICGTRSNMKCAAAIEWDEFDSDLPYLLPAKEGTT